MCSLRKYPCSSAGGHSKLNFLSKLEFPGGVGGGGVGGLRFGKQETFHGGEYGYYFLELRNGQMCSCYLVFLNKLYVLF